MSRPVPHIKALHLVILVALVVLVPRLAVGERPAVTAIFALGFLLLAGHQAGRFVKAFGIPAITSYLLLGMAAGPSLGGLLTPSDVHNLVVVDQLALVLIGLTAGAELEISILKRGLGVILAIVGFQSLVVFTIVTGGFFALSGHLALFEGYDGMRALAGASLIGVIALTSSPAATVAVVLESRSAGPFTEALMGSVVAKDVVVAAAFAVVVGIAVPIITGGGDSAGTSSVQTVVLEILASVALGALIGAVAAFVLAYTIRNHGVMFALGLAVLLTALASALHLESLLMAMSAGFALGNIAEARGIHGLKSKLEAAWAPIALIFFSVAGAHLQLESLQRLWAAVALYVGLRAVGLMIGTRIGAVVGRGPESMRRFGGAAYVSQAGLCLGMVAVVQGLVPGLGGEMRDLIVGVVAIEELVGPVLLRLTLKWSGEAGNADEAPPAPTTTGRMKARPAPSG